MPLWYFSADSCLWKPCNISAQNFVLYNKYVFLSSVVTVITGSDGDRTFLPSVFHAQGGPHTQGSQQRCLGILAVILKRLVISTGLGQRRGKESYLVLFCPPMAKIELQDTLHFSYWINKQKILFTVFKSSYFQVIHPLG